MPRSFVWPVCVYYEDTDAMGVVYYANHLKFMERARTEWLRALGFEQDRLLKEHRVIFPVRHVEVEYLKPARFNDRLEVHTRLAGLAVTRMRFEHSIVRADGTGLARGRVTVVCVDADTFRPSPIPEGILSEIRDGS